MSSRPLSSRPRTASARTGEPPAPPTRQATARRHPRTSANSSTSPRTPISSGRKSARLRHSWRGDDSIGDAQRGTRRLPAPAAASHETMMIRTIALAIMLGALAASVAVYTISPPGWRDVIAPLFGGPDRRVETAIALEELPICTTMAAAASDADWAQLEPDFNAGKKALSAQDWTGPGHPRLAR